MKEDMEEVLIKFILGEASGEESERVKRWIGENPDHAKKYADFKLIWESSKQVMHSTKVNEDDAWERFKERVRAGSDIHPISRRLLSPWLKMAAIFVLVSIGLWIAYTALVQPVNDSTLTVETANEIKIDTLSDGSVITLNKHSKLSFPAEFARNQRKVTLQEGEAFFNIAPDAQKPFIIRVGEVDVKVVGTSFNIKTRQDHMELIVETGIVEVSQDDIVVRLKRKEKIDIDQSANSFRKSTNTDQLYRYYRSKEFVAEDTPLWRLVEVLNEAYEVHIRIEGDSLRNTRLNTTFKREESIDAIMDIIGETLRIQVDRQGDQVLLHN